MTRFGIEEEFQLLDEDTLVPVPLGSAARAALPSGTGEVKKEFLTSQVEFSTSPVDTLAAAGEELMAFRRALASFAHDRGAVAIGSGTPFGIGPEASVFASERYDTVAHWLGHIVDSHHVNALHLHVEVPDEEDRVRALNAVRPWMPTLLAVSGNSPFADGHDTGHASWRTVIMRRLPLSGCPPHFRDMRHYRSEVDRLVAQQVIPDIASVCWAARLSANYPTVELRLFDAQLSPEDALLLAALGRALVESATSAGDPVHTGDDIQASLWAAARAGLGATLVDPSSGRLIAAKDAVCLLLQTISPALEKSGDLAFVTDGLDRVLRTGTGAQRQRAAYAEGGITALRALHAVASDSEVHDAAGQQ
ncbi:carboxylate-amine ligase [Microbacterium abyssi]|uniref:carboxylate-amine ligase n=1 Tax=Microbacterium abyssi TaxID=2782166 RepID=UPI00188747B6|nr:YbdK family carboxylate-amine ligase [Microbacterium sp. A18JL241]